MFTQLRSTVALVTAVLFIGCSGNAPSDAGGSGGGSAKNAEPVLEPIAAVTLDEAQTADVTLSATDADGDEVTFELVSPPSFVTLTGNKVHLAPGFDAVTSGTSANHDISLLVKDGAGGHSVSGSFAVTVKQVNRPPALGALGQVSMFGGQTMNLTLPGVDPDSDPLTYSVDSAAPGWATISGATLTLTPPTTTALTVQLTVTVSDGALTATQQLDLTVTTGVVTGSVAINGSALYANAGAVMLTLTSASTGGDVTQMRFSNDGATFSALEPFAATKSWTLDTATQGTKTVTAELVDENGVAHLVTDTILFDSQAPALSGFSSNGGAPTATSNTVQLTYSAQDDVGASGLATVEVSNDGLTFTAVGPGPLSWNLTSGDGPKTVTLRGSDLAGNVGMLTLNVLVDTVAPTITSFITNGGADATNNPAILVDTVASDGTGSGLATIEFSEITTTNWSTPAPYSAQLTHTIPTGDRYILFWARVRDVAGNYSQPIANSNSIWLDQTIPTAGYLRINDDAPATKSINVTVVYGATESSGVARTCTRWDPGTPTFGAPPPQTDPCWGAYGGTTIPQNIPAGADGSWRMTSWFKDFAGNISPVSTFDDIFLDRQTPTMPGAVSLLSVQYRTISVATSGATDAAPSSGMSYEFGYRQSGSTAPYTYVAPTTVGATMRVQLSAANTYELVLRAVDQAGNSSVEAGPFTATTYFPWTPVNRRYGSPPQPHTAAAVVGGNRFAIAGQAVGEAWIDNADGFATSTRMDTTAWAIAPVGTTDRALYVNAFGADFTVDQGRTFWPMTFTASPASNFVSGTYVGTTVTGTTTVDRFVVVGGGGSLFRGSVTHTPGSKPVGTFSPVVTGTTAVFWDVATCLGCTGEVVVAVSSSALILRSIDGGLTWSTVTAPGSLSLSSVVSVPGTQLLYAGGGNGVIRSTDGGLTWTAVSGFSGYIQELAVGGSGANYTLWAAIGISTGSVVRYDGTTATSISLASIGGSMLTPYGIAAVGSGPNAEALAVGVDGEVVHFAQNGSVVTRRSTGSTATVQSVAFAYGSATRAIWVGDQGTAVTSSNGGQSWTAETTGTTQRLNAVVQFQDLSAVAVGQSGGVLVRTSFGSWSQTPSPVATPLNAVSCSAAVGSCLIAGASGAVLGYDPVTLAVTPLLLNSSAQSYSGVVLYQDSSLQNRAVVVGGNAIRTCVGCGTASSFLPEVLIAPPTGSTVAPTFYAVAARPDGRVIAVGSGGSFSVAYVSNDHGSSWARVGSTGGFGARAIINISNTNTWYAAGDRFVSVSTNDGATWSSLPTYSYLDGRSLAIPDLGAAPRPILAGGTNGTLLLSTTGGL